jgi:hypothetical protein
MLRTFPALSFAGFSIVLALGGCDRDKSSELSQLGEPIGAQLQADGNVPALSLAFAVSKGQDPVPLLPHIVGAVATAVRRCPAFAVEEKATITTLAFTVENHTMKLGPRPEAPPGVRCVASALDGKDIASAPARLLNGRIEIMISAPAAARP